MTPDSTSILSCRVAKVEHLARDIRRIFLRTTSVKRLAFKAGQYIDILLPDGQRRSFSIASMPSNNAFIELHIRMVDGGKFSHDILDNLTADTTLNICGPFGNLYLRENSRRPIIFMAGGTGFSPIKAIIEHALARGITRPMHLYWGARTKNGFYLDTLVNEWTVNYPHFTYTPIMSEPLHDARQEKRDNPVNAIIADYPNLSDHEIYASGPPTMISTGYAAFVAQRLSPENFFADHFEFDSTTAAATPHLASVYLP